LGCRAEVEDKDIAARIQQATFGPHHPLKSQIKDTLLASAFSLFKSVTAIVFLISSFAT
jgi:hypothetical protein